MELSTICNARTTINKEVHKSVVTIDWTDMTIEDVQALAQRSLIIRKQNADRVAGIVPAATYTLKACEYRIGIRNVRTSMSAEDALNMLTPEALTALLQSKGLL